MKAGIIGHKFFLEYVIPMLDWSAISCFKCYKGEIASLMWYIVSSSVDSVLDIDFKSIFFLQTF